MSLIECKDVSFSYNGKMAVDKINFTVSNGDYLGIIGENGAGKSTLIKGLLQLKKANSGKIILNEDIKRNEIGYLPQQINIQKDFPASVQEIVLSGCINKMKWKPFYTISEKKIAKENMEKLSILSIKNRCYNELSGGQQQRVLLARALCATKKIIILDEPTTGLDPLVTKELYNVVEKINKELKICIIIVSHDIKNTIKYAKNILLLQNKQIFFGSTEKYLKSNLSEKFGGDTNV